MGTAPKKRAATSAKKTTKKKSATKKASAKKVTKKPAAKKTTRKGTTAKKKASKKKPLRPELPQFPRSITLRNRVGLALMSPYRLPLDSQTLAMTMARASGFAFVVLGTMLAAYNALALLNTNIIPSSVSVVIPTPHTQMAHLVGSGATNTESTTIDTATTTATTTDDSEVIATTTDDISTTTDETPDVPEDAAAGAIDTDSQTPEVTESQVNTEPETVTLETDTNSANFITTQMILIFSSIIVVLLGLVLIIIGLYIHRKQLKDREAASASGANIISPSAPPSAAESTDVQQ